MTHCEKFIQRNRVKIICGIPLLLLAGCATPGTGGPRPYSYRESVASIYVSQDRKSLVVLGDQYHYIFGVPPRLLEFLSSPLRPHFYPVFEGFFVEENRHISGSLYLTLTLRPADMSPEEKELAAGLGMRLPPGESGYEVYGSGYISLKGDRFRANPMVVRHSAPDKLNQTYDINIGVRITQEQRQAELAQSPINQIGDGLFTLLTIPLLPFLLMGVVGRGGK
jgi:hypothetical protein